MERASDDNERIQDSFRSRNLRKASTLKQAIQKARLEPRKCIVRIHIVYLSTKTEVSLSRV